VATVVRGLAAFAATRLAAAFSATFADFFAVLLVAVLFFVAAFFVDVPAIVSLQPTFVAVENWRHLDPLAVALVATAIVTTLPSAAAETRADDLHRAGRPPTPLQQPRSEGRVFPLLQLAISNDAEQFGDLQLKIVRTKNGNGRPASSTGRRMRV
jgi:hypothetical protein